MPHRILIVDDEKVILRSISGALEDEGYAVDTACNGAEALAALAITEYDAVLLDIWMPGIDGMKVLEKLHSDGNPVPVIIMSGHGSIETAVRATKLGAYDFLEKPLSLDKLLVLLERAIQQSKLIREVRLLRETISEKSEILGKSPAIVELREQIKIVAPTQSWVLITGENGTGKEVAARSIHRASVRSDDPFVEVNCAAIPEELIESELFGHIKGAFTGATSNRKGKFEAAEGGTIFLDEIADMSLKTQAKILRILQEHKFERLGSTETLEIDVRVIAATNKNLEQMIAEGTFREDLYYRINVIPLHVPQLRDRKEDIPVFVDHFLKLHCLSHNSDEKKITRDAMRALAQYNWPGNVRELKNLVERLCIMIRGAKITLADLPDSIRSSDKITGEQAMGHSTLSDARAEFEREFIAKKLELHEGNISKTAENIGLSREALSRKIKALGIVAKK
jgi:two-component system, NtrC family, nitrogen regulation response regulator NtrX